MKTFLSILKWLTGISLLLISTSSDLSILEIFLYIILGLFITPISYNFIAKKSNITLPSWSKWVITIAGCIVLYIFQLNKAEENRKEIKFILDKANQLLDKGEIDSANIYISKAKGENKWGVTEVSIIEKNLIDYQSEDVAKDTLVSMTDNEFSQLKKGVLKKSYFPQKYLNTNFISLMKKLAPQRAIIIKSNKLEIERKKRKEKEKKRQKLIDEQFSAWDGSHIGLTKMLKKNMKNPDSYEHIETTYRDDGKSLVIKTRYRGQNGFGGMTIGEVTARVNFNGDVLEIISQN
ncbi:hypothetical protein N9254_02025 [Flavobacteriaceae bacterium]|jgi:hypothetical protein|nr:hypothetical protein [Flavobacteriaceae bacterium]